MSPGEPHIPPPPPPPKSEALSTARTIPSACQAVSLAGACGPPWLALGRARGPVPQRSGGLSSLSLDGRCSFSNNPPVQTPGLKAAAVGGEPGRYVLRLCFPQWRHLGAGFKAERISPFSPAWHSPFLLLATTKPSVWVAALKVRRCCGGREAHEIPRHGDTVKEGGCAAVTMLASAKQLLANALPAREMELGRLNSL